MSGACRTLKGRPTPACAFGFAYAQAEDYFWQIEDTYVASLGRYAELIWRCGSRLRPVESLVRNSQASRRPTTPSIEPPLKAICEAYAAGIEPLPGQASAG